MNKLGELRGFIENLPEDKTFRFSLDGPFSWRGNYQEVGFCIVRRECSKKELLEVVNDAFTGTFEGYKGGEYTYDEETRINFENDDSCYTRDWCRGPARKTHHRKILWLKHRRLR